jgi:hypothetical protein
MDGDTAIGATLADFWGWSASDLVSNTMRGVLAEFIVARALGVSTEGVRTEWDAYDLCLADGTTIEVKSAAYLQSWHQQELSTITFRIPKTRAWSADTGLYQTIVTRQAAVYVFAVLRHSDKATVNPLDVSQWRFHVLPTAVLNERARSQHSITLNTLERLAGPGLRFEGLAPAVHRAAALASVG